MYSLGLHQDKFDRKSLKKPSVFWAFKMLSWKCYKNYNFNNFEKNSNEVRSRLLKIHFLS